MLVSFGYDAAPAPTPGVCQQQDWQLYPVLPQVEQ